MIFLKSVYTLIVIMAYSRVQSSSRNFFTTVCSGQFKQAPAEQRKLQCRYVDNGVPFCLIAPFKMEELSLDPYVALYLEAIYDNEINNILTACRDKVTRSTVNFEGVPQITINRTSRHTYLHNRPDLVKKLDRRLEDMTGLSTKTSEYMQVANYEVGEYYRLHHDLMDDNVIDEWFGHRILTALFYISDVELGGATVFPDISLAVKPLRRSMLMWYNLYKSLAKDFRTKHGGCPVIKGSKWILTKWFHTMEQEFRRPCDLRPYV